MTATSVVDSVTVAGAWLRTISGIPDNKVNTVLPDRALWADTGFVQVVGVVGGTPWIDASVRDPVLEIDTWGCRLNSDKPDWGKASALMDKIVRAATLPATSVGVLLTIGDKRARVITCFPVSEVRRPITGIDAGDAASFARFMIDLQMTWVEVPE